MGSVGSIGSVRLLDLLDQSVCWIRWIYQSFGSSGSVSPVNVPRYSASAKPDCRSVDSEAKCVDQSLIYQVFVDTNVVPKVLTVR